MAETRLTRQQHGQIVDAVVGSALVVQLDEAPTTGCTWTNLTTGDVLVLQASDFSPAKAGAVGGSGQRTWRFAVRQAGTTTVQLRLRQAWDASASALDTYSVEVHATAH